MADDAKRNWVVRAEVITVVEFHCEDCTEAEARADPENYNTEAIDHDENGNLFPGSRLVVLSVRPDTDSVEA